jgi:hypothetical protein
MALRTPLIMLEALLMFLTSVFFISLFLSVDLATPFFRKAPIITVTDDLLLDCLLPEFVVMLPAALER